MDKFTILYYWHIFLDWLTGFFRSNPVVIRLAVAGSTSTGKTYLLADMVGSIEKLGYDYCPRQAGSTPHRNKQDLINNQGLTTPRASYRQKDLYVLPFKLRDSRGTKKLLIKLLDVPGEALDINSLHMFQAIKESLLACDKKYFEVTVWWDAEHHCTVRTVRVIQKAKSSRYPGIVIHVHPRGYQASNEYLSTDSREEQLEEEGFKVVKDWKFWKRSKITGAELFEHFLDYDTDSAIEAIHDIWEKLNIGNHLPEPLKKANDPTGCELFKQIYQNDFFCHYYTEKATDVVVCDLCCTTAPSEAESAGQATQTSNEDNFLDMMQVLGQIVNSGAKKSYMVLKAIDLVMKDAPYRELFHLCGTNNATSLSDDGQTNEATDEHEPDPNLVYSLFLMLLAKARSMGLLGHRDNANEGQMPPTITKEEACTWLTDADGRNTPEATIQWVMAAYNALNESTFSEFFEDPDNYATTSSLSLDGHIKQRIEEFRRLNPIPQGYPKSTVEKKLDLPKHTYFVATPIDDDFRKCKPADDTPTLFTGKARYYNHRMYFGALQLTIDMLKNASTNIDFSDTYKGYGKIIAHLTDSL